MKEGHENVPPSQTVKKMNEKIYTYDPKRYAVRITGIGYFSVLIMLYSIYQLIASKKLYFIAVIVVCLYIVWESFITLANPDKVIISDDEITFTVKEREDRYLWKDIRDFRVKEFIDRKQVYIRINKQNPSLFKGRYWVYCRYFNDADELFMFFIKKEMEIHPDTIKAYARRGSKPAEKK